MVTAFDRVSAALKEPKKRLTKAQRMQLKRDLEAVRDNAYAMRKLGVEVKLSRYMQAMLRTYQIPFEE